ncbi:sugar porter family MFS transporter [Bifidobacterium longum]|uniref:sugar porter family MFS transporter n=1 Tax=Bifidobacterium longum TaxID=216816 RepID=UPI0010409323|nr:sugar porter family MFS transporter [Bifidobacterium longum]NRC98921.1 sugar porter family MFS transporter [Bifidobacterium longum subsp. longum]TCE29697.1 transport protein [Bifidobacterium longum subsp. longum]
MAGLFRTASKQPNPLGTAIRTRGSGKYTFGLALSAGLAGLLYGYDIVSISGAIEFLRARYGLSTLMEGLVVSSIMLGAVIGAATAGFLSDRFGRKRILIIGGAFFLVAAVWSALTIGPIALIVARVAGGYGIGLTAALAVTYITESAPANIRGLLAFSYQLLAVCGIFLTNVINYIIASHGSNDWDIATGWRWMLGLGAIPAATFLLAMRRAPESPRFLIQIGRTDEGFAVLEHILGTERARLRTDDIQASVKLETEMSHEFHDLFRPGLRRALVIGIFLAVFNQFIGMNAISYYGPVMFSDLGFAGDTQFLAAASVGGMELVATVVGMYLIDTFGRKRLMEIGTGMMCVFALCISGSYFMGNSLLTLIFVMAFTISFAFSMGPIPWIVIPELFPTYLRGRATGLCVMCLLFANWIIAQFTPMMIDGLGGGISFAIFAVLDLICLFGIVALVPETMGRTLEEIEHLWQPKTDLAYAKYALSTADANIRHAEATLRRIENERQQALGIMDAAERARAAAQQKFFAIETAKRAEAERLAAQRAAEEAAKAAANMAAEEDTAATVSEVTTDENVPSLMRRTRGAVLVGKSSSRRHDGEYTDGSANGPADGSVDGSVTDSADGAMLDGAAAEAAASAAVAALADSLPDDPFTLANRPTTSSGADDTDSVDAADAVDSANDANRNRKQTNAVQPAHMASIGHAHSADMPRGVLLPSADEDSDSEHSFAETDDDREAQAINAALDSLDTLIRG